MFFGHSITTKLLFFLVWSSTSLTFAQQLEVDWAPEFIPGRPGEVQIEGPIALGNGEYKIQFSAPQPTAMDVAIPYQIVGDFDPNYAVFATLRLVDHPVHTNTFTSDGFSGRFGPVSVTPGEVVTFELTVTQPDNPIDVTQVSDVAYTVPLGPHPINFFADVDSDGSYELTGGATSLLFSRAPGAGILLSGYATAGGLERHFQTILTLVNRAPVIERLITNPVADTTGNELLLYVEATDLDGDDLTYRVNWGDGHENFFDRPLMSHEYAADGPYQITVLAIDYNSESAQETTEFAFPGASDQAPVVRHFSEYLRQGKTVSYVLDAYDPEGTGLQYELNWGDGSDPEFVSGPFIFHEFPPNQPANYLVSALIRDGFNNEVVATIETAFGTPDVNEAPTVHGIHLVEQEDRRIVIAVAVDDPDSPQLTFDVNWGDGTETVGSTSPFVGHVYADDLVESYVVEVIARDLSDNAVSSTLTVNFAVQENEAPNELEIEELFRDGFHWAGLLESNDPDGNEITYVVDFGDGSVPIITKSDIVHHHFPADVYTTYQGAVQATDEFGLSITREFSVTFEPPAENQPPELLVFEVLSSQGRQLLLKVDGVGEANETISVDIDWGDGFVLLNQNVGVFAHQFDESVHQFTISVTLRDDRGGAVDETMTVSFEPPYENQPPAFVDVREISRSDYEVLMLALARDPELEPISYRWRFDDGTPDIFTDEPILSHTFPNNVSRVYTVQIRGTDASGLFSETILPVSIEPPPPNQAPVVTDVQLIRTSTYGVSAFVDAYDPDDNDLSYRFEWGDGSEADIAAAPFAGHSYPSEVFREYTVSVVASDGIEESNLVTVSIYIEQPPLNGNPSIDDIDIRVGPRGHVELRIFASDDQNDPVHMSVDWGDGSDVSETSVLRGGFGEHHYDYRPTLEPYIGSVTLVDEEGLSSRSDFSVIIVDEPTEILQLEASPLGDGRIFLTLVALDPDASDELIYSFDFDNDSVFEQPGRLQNSAFHAYEEPGTYQANVMVTDPWSGQETYASITLDVDPWQTAPRTPSFGRAHWSYQPGGYVELSFEVVDPDAQMREMRIFWGDEAEGATGILLNQPYAQHRYEYSLEPYIVRLEGTDTSGTLIEKTIEVVVNDEPSEVLDFRYFELGGGRVFLSADFTDPDSPFGLSHQLDLPPLGSVDLTGFGALDTVVTFDSPGTHTVQLSVQDMWSGNLIERGYEVNVSPWVADVSDTVTVDDLQVVVEPGGFVRVDYRISTSELANVQVFVHWGDELSQDDFEQVGAFSAVHRYLTPRVDRPYRGFLKIISDDEASMMMPFEVTIADSPTTIVSIDSRRLARFEWAMDVRATDDDEAALLYSFDLNDDGDFEVTDTTDSSFYFQLNEALDADVPVRVNVRDPWSNVTVEERYLIQLGQAADNEAPLIETFEVRCGHGGLCTASLSAVDPENDRLTFRLLWGDGDLDEAFGTTYAQFEHRYPRPLDSVLVTLRVTDAFGQFDEEQVMLSILDSPTRSISFSATSIQDGYVMMTAFAFDPDGQLFYAFDVDGDGTYERADSFVNHWVYEYAEPGIYQPMVRIVDVWSGESVTETIELEIESEPQPLPFPSDHVVLGEGECLALSILPEFTIQNETSSGRCGVATTEEDSPWHWTMGDGADYFGERIYHQYRNQGTFDINLRDTRASEGSLEANLTVSVKNLPPRVRSVLYPVAHVNEPYAAELFVTDPGVDDAIEVDFVQAPDGMTLTQVDDDRWRIDWVPSSDQQLMVAVILEAKDGRWVDDVFLEDGGQERFQYQIVVHPERTLDVTGANANAATPELVGGGSGCMIDRQEHPLPMIFLLAAFILVTIRPRRRSLRR